MVAQEAGTAPTIFARTLRDIISRIFLHCILKRLYLLKTHAARFIYHQKYESKEYIRAQERDFLKQCIFYKVVKVIVLHFLNECM